ncbi:MAG: DUF1573 domain-containing protein [Flavobacteriales bacterium]
MKKENLIIGAIAVIGLLTLFNTYKVLTSGEGRTIPPLDTRVAQNNVAPNAGANFPSQLPQQNQPSNPGAQTQPNSMPVSSDPVTGINFATPKKDFGKVLSTSSNKHTFVFTNTGTEPLIISNAKGSCGCTVPAWPKEPILPGDKGEIDIVYKPNGQSGKQTKQITVTANTSPANTILTITGDIQPDPNAPKPQAISPQDAAAMQ